MKKLVTYAERLIYRKKEFLYPKRKDLFLFPYCNNLKEIVLRASCVLS